MCVNLPPLDLSEYGCINIPPIDSNDIVDVGYNESSILVRSKLRNCDYTFIKDNTVIIVFAEYTFGQNPKAKISIKSINGYTPSVHFCDEKFFKELPELLKAGYSIIEVPKIPLGESSWIELLKVLKQKQADEKQDVIFKYGIGKAFFEQNFSWKDLYKNAYEELLAKIPKAEDLYATLNHNPKYSVFDFANFLDFMEREGNI